MPLTLRQDQKEFMRDGQRVQRLAEWVLTTDNHIAVNVRRAANLARSAAPTRKDTQHMMDHLSSGNVGDSDLVHLINGYNFHHPA